MLTIRTLGKFQIRDEEHIVNEEEIRSPKMINLLAYLIIHRNQTLTFYDMADALWQEEETGNPAGALKNLMYRLRVSSEEKLWRRGLYPDRSWFLSLESQTGSGSGCRTIRTNV